MLIFIKKDLLLFWRNRREMAIVVLLPIILILVLNFAFSNVFGTDSKPLALTLAVVNEDMDQGESRALLDRLQQPELSEWLTVKELKESEALQQVEQGTIDAMIKFPTGFTNYILNSGSVDQGSQDSAMTLSFIVKENSLSVSVIQELLSEYLDGINFAMAFSHVAGKAPDYTLIPAGGREMIEGAEPFKTSQYFTIAMGLLFSLFIASSVAEKTGSEKREQVFNRIILTNTRPFAYLVGKTWATFGLSWMQISLVILVSQLLLGVFSGKSTVFWLGLLLLVTLYAMAMAGLSALYTSISLKLRSMDAANAIFLMITMIFGILGGNFVPIYFIPSWLQRIGEWTPNGLTLAVITEWIQYGEFRALVMPTMMLVIFAAGCFFIGIALYPKRGEG